MHGTGPSFFLGNAARHRTSRAHILLYITFLCIVPPGPKYRPQESNNKRDNRPNAHVEDWIRGVALIAVRDIFCDHQGYQLTRWKI